MIAQRPPTLRARPPRPSELSPADVRWLMWHEACSHGLIGREVRDLGDAYLLHDPTDREPFWNRIVGISWPSAPGPFDRRLTEVLALFAGLDRMPHAWPIPGYDEPPDLAARLLSHGFEDHGGGLLMLLDPEHAQSEPALPGVDGATRVTTERLHRLVGPAAERAARATAEVLIAAFDVEPERRVAIELEAVQALTDDAYHVVLVRVDGQPAAVARRTTFSGASYLSSIGTHPAFRGRGLGRLVTSIATRDGLAEGSGLTYLGVFEENAVAQRMYESLGFVRIGGVAPDLLLRP